MDAKSTYANQAEGNIAQQVDHWSSFLSVLKQTTGSYQQSLNETAGMIANRLMMSTIDKINQ
ncbi:MAG: hypothetical protein Q9M16_09395 [Mariprofundus sp.]|nr:hypothetical protein [Mariprofundus sp.]